MPKFLYRNVQMFTSYFDYTALIYPMKSIICIIKITSFFIKWCPQVYKVFYSSEFQITETSRLV